MYKISAKRLRGLLAKRKMSLDMLQRLTGIKKQSLARIITDDSVVKLSTLKIVATYLNVRPYEILTDEDNFIDQNATIKIDSEKLRTLLAEKKTYQYDLAAKIGASPSYFKRIFKSFSATISRYYFDKIVALLGCKAEDLLPDEKIPKAKQEPLPFEDAAKVEEKKSEEEVVIIGAEEKKSEPEKLSDEEIEKIAAVEAEKIAGQFAPEPPEFVKVQTGYVRVSAIDAFKIVSGRVLALFNFDTMELAKFDNDELAWEYVEQFVMRNS